MYRTRLWAPDNLSVNHYHFYMTRTSIRTKCRQNCGRPVANTQMFPNLQKISAIFPPNSKGLQVPHVYQVICLRAFNNCSFFRKRLLAFHQAKENIKYINKKKRLMRRNTKTSLHNQLSFTWCISKDCNIPKSFSLSTTHTYWNLFLNIILNFV